MCKLLQAIHTSSSTVSIVVFVFFSFFFQLCSSCCCCCYAFCFFLLRLNIRICLYCNCTTESIVSIYHQCREYFSSSSLVCFFLLLFDPNFTLSMVTRACFRLLMTLNAKSIVVLVSLISFGCFVVVAVGFFFFCFLLLLFYEKANTHYPFDFEYAH